ncbi:MAG TPA: hypothetical protein VGE26_05990 [Sphingobacteriaceae bacterium]
MERRILRTENRLAIVQPPKKPAEAPLPTDPEDPIIPEDDPDLIPEDDPFETPPYEEPVPGEGP